MVGTFHWTRNCGTFKAGMNGTKLSKSQKINFANVSLSNKFWEQKSNKMEISGKNVSKIWAFLVRLSSFPEVPGNCFIHH